MNANLTKSDGTPASGVIASFVINDSSIVAFTGASDQKTNNDGIATVEIQGKKTGVTSVSAKATVEGEIEIDEFTINVT